MRARFACLCFLLPFAAFPQITVTSDALPAAGDSYGVYYDFDLSAAFTVTPPGPNAQSWDYSSAFDVDDAFAVHWVAPSSLPGNELFPEANLAAGTGEFYSANADGLYISGYFYEDAAHTDELHVTDGLFMPTPFTYGSSRSVLRRMTYMRIYTTGAPAERVEFYADLASECDAWGTLRTPAYPDGVEVLRIEHTRINAFDSIFFDFSGTGDGPWTFDQSVVYDDQIPYYEFVQAQAPYSVMGIGQDLAFAAYVSSAVPIGLDEPGEPQRASFAYPVPSHGDVVHIALADPAVTTVRIRDAMGQELITIPVRGVEVLNLETGAWSAGTYTYTCSHSDGSLADHGRFLIVR